ncbi:type II toxin-antitoxin system HicA family toxin [Pedomonas sp. V897]|uniref:type II toxin-antitoxin system HicA family toxin n=1 Tax=Pedomonas sp. V897 TaxID=3446482 RepID=UPI003EE0A9E2
MSDIAHMNGDELLRRLRQAANRKGQTFQTKPGKGDHVKVYIGSRMAPIPGRKEEIKTGTLLSILRMLGLTKQDLE